MLSIVPDALFLAYVCLRFAQMRSQQVKLVKPGWILLGTKLVFASAVITSNAGMVAFQLLRLQRQGWPVVGLTASLMSLVTSMPLAVLVVCEHLKSFTPSTLIICYTGVVKGLFGSVSLRTGHQIGMLQTNRPSFIVFAAATFGYFAMSLVELFEKHHLFKDAYKKYPSQSSSSFLARVFYLWLIPVLWRGHKTRLTLGDLEPIPEPLKAAPAREHLEAKLKRTRPNSIYLFIATAKAFAMPLLAPTLPRLILLLATFAQPLLVNDMIAFVNSPEQPTSRGWAIVGGFTCVYFAITLSTAVYWEKIYAVTVEYRAALVGSIYHKTLRLASHECHSVGSGAASTYMSVDVERICEGLEFIHEFWASIVSIALSIVILYRQAYWAAFMPMVVIAIILGITSAFAKDVDKQQSKWMAATDKRIKFISSVIDHFLPMKWAAYERLIERDTAMLRDTEVERGRKFCILVIVTASLSNIASMICTVVALSTYAAIASSGNGRGALDVTRMFSIVTTVQLLSYPLNILGQLLPVILAAYASLKRIQEFLLLEEKSQLDSLEKEPKEIRILGSFAWGKDSDPALTDIDARIPYNQLTMCIGTVAAGKTTLLMSLLGETVSSNRSGEIHGPVAYAAQDAFIFPGSVRENIICHHAFDDAKYSRVLAACALTPDLERLPYGDQTRLGDKGLALSGGQKQRVGLARAIYVQAPVTLLDDSFSALDAVTEAHVFEALFGPGGLLGGRTVVLVTHNLNHVAFADWVLVLDGGHVSHQGVLSDIQNSGYDLLSEQNMSSARLRSPENANAPYLDHEKQHDDDDETTRQYSSRGLTPYRFFFRASGWYNVFISALFMVLWRSLIFASQGYIKEWSESNGKHLGAWIGGYVAFGVATFITSLIALGYYLLGMTLTSSRKIHEAELKSFLSCSSSITMKMSAGRLINRFSQDIFTLDFTFPIAVVNAVASVLSVAGTLVLVVIPTPYLALLIPPLAVLYAIVLKFYLSTSKQLQALEAASKSPLYRIFGTTLEGLETIRALQMQLFFEKQNDYHLNQSQGPFYFRFAGIAFLRTTLSAITMIISITLASLAVGLRHTTSPSLLGVALSNLTTMTLVLSSLLMSWASVENGTVGLQRIHEVVELSPEEDSKNPATILPEEGSWPICGSVVFEDFGMRYKEDLDPVLSGINLHIQGGKKIGICGRTGAGKTSMLLALFRASPPSLITGKILIDGIDISTLTLQVLRSSLSVVSQDPFLWHASVRVNLDIEEACTDEEVWAALRRVDMSEAVSDLPEKLETVLEKASLSRGQRQLLCMARVLLRKRQIVVLDEATSSMDLITDQNIREIIRTDLTRQTVITVAHRIATICDSDIVVVLENGEIVESGPPQELLENPQSAFARLADSQGIKQGLS